MFGSEVRSLVLHTEVDMRRGPKRLKIEWLDYTIDHSCVLSLRMSDVVRYACVAIVSVFARLVAGR